MPLSAAEIDRAFPARIPPVSVKPTYWLALIAVLSTLVLLQLLYLALVAAAALATLGYAAMLPGILSAVRINFLTLPLIAAPLAAGAIATFFLFKPVFASPPAPAPPLELAPESEGALFAFVNRLCDCLGAPRPKHIFVTLDVNASASFHRGWRGLFTNQLALTIGLPLVQGLPLRQFAGVLAHEFGHFSQSAGLRAHFLIGSIQFWFLRVAHDRDEWDLKLERWYGNAGWRGKIIWGLAKGVVAASRAILSGLQKAANVCSAAFSRQMEFDADRYEALIAGVDAFEATTIEMPLLSVTANHAWNDLKRSFGAQRLAGDIPALMALRRDGLDAAVADTVKDFTLAEVTGRFATHPSPSDRIASVRALGAEGTFGLDGPATRLFSDFAELSRAASRHHYVEVLGLDMSRLSLDAVEAVTEESGMQEQREAARREIFGDSELVSRWLRWPASDPADGEARDLDDGEYWRLVNEVLLQAGAVALLECGAKIKPEVFHVSKSDAMAAHADHERSLARLGEEARALRVIAGPRMARIWRAAQTADSTDFAQFRAMLAEQDSLLAIRMALVSEDLLEANAEHVPGNGAVAGRNRYGTRAVTLRREVQARLAAFESLATQLTVPEGLSGTDATRWFLDRADWLSERLLERICWSVIELEKS